MSGGSSPSYNISPYIEKGQPTVYFNNWQTTSGTTINRTVGIAHSNNLMRSPVSEEDPVSTDNSTKDWMAQGLASRTFHDTDFTVTYNPKFSSSKFLVIASLQGYWETTPGGFGLGISRTVGGTRTLIRGIDGTPLGNSWMDGLNGWSGQGNSTFSCQRFALDEPAYTVGQDITWKIAVGWWSASGRLFFGGTRSSGGQFYLSNHTNITVLEIEDKT